MTRRRVIRAEASDDIEEIFRWYEAQKPGLGSEFLSALETCLAEIERHPELNPQSYRRGRRALLRRFPYAVVYLVHADTIDVVACVHVRRNPERWRSRV